jgi:hypothetical protein
MTTEIQISTFIETELEKFDVTTEALQDLVEPVKALKINGVDDREGYVKVREARLMLKNKRVEIEKSGRALRDNALKFQKAVIVRQTELVSIIEGEEIRLKREEEQYEEERERIRMENERKETERIQSRINALAKYSWAIDFYEAKIMPEEEYLKLLETAEAEFIKEQQRIAAEKEEQEKLQRLEQERLRKDREELELLRAEQSKREAEMKAEQERIAKQQAEKEQAFRLEQDRIRKEQEEREAALKAERNKLEAEKRRIELEEAKKEAAEKARIEAEQLEQRKAETKRLQEEEAIREAKRQEALKPDKEKLLDFADRILALRIESHLEDRAAEEIEMEAYDLLAKLHDHIKVKVKSL